MKNFNQYITEKIKLSKDRFDVNYTEFPETKEELVEIIRAEIEKNGWECDLNHIDVRKITDMSYLFCWGKNGYNLHNFNGTISKWDVSKVTNMERMFCCSHFNSDISEWDVSNVTNMDSMFIYNKIFNQDISKWKIKKECNTKFMFYDCYIKYEFKPKKE